MDTANTTEVTPDPTLVAAVATKVEHDEGLILPPKPPAPKNNSWERYHIDSYHPCNGYHWSFLRVGSENQ